MVQSERRRQLLEDLVKYRRTPREILPELRGFPWDAEEPLVSLGAADVRSVLARFCSGALTHQEVEEWAEAVEARDDIDFPDDDLLREILFRLANPELQGRIEIEEARDIYLRLSGE